MQKKTLFFPTKVPRLLVLVLLIKEVLGKKFV
jgi:hypothetical protein